MKECIEDEINRTTYLLIKPEYGGEWTRLCVNQGKEICKKCQQIQCDSAGGGVPRPSEYKWIVSRRKEDEVSE